MIKVTVLGSNGWYEDANGQTTSVLIQSDQGSILLDAGSGLTRARTRIDFTKPGCLFLTHLHLDHISGLHTLSLFPFDAGLSLITPLGGKDELLSILRPPFMSNLEKQSYPTRLVEAETLPQNPLPFKVSALPLEHAVPSTGYRLEIDGKIIAFVLDTAYCENAVKLAKDADLLITEAGFFPGQTGTAGHLDPEGAARLSKEANAKRTLLVHFGASVYTEAGMRAAAVDDARAIFPNLITGTDLCETLL